MEYQTVIKYNIEGMRMYKLPIITICPLDYNINIKILFPDIDDIDINICSKDIDNIIIKQIETEPYPNMNLLLNDTIISTKRHFYNNGTIIITTYGYKCNYTESFEMYYDT